MSVRNIFVDGYIPANLIDPTISFAGPTGPKGDQGAPGITGATGPQGPAGGGTGGYDPNPAFSTITMNCKAPDRLGIIRFPFDYPSNNWNPVVNEVILGQGITQDWQGQNTNGIIVAGDNAGQTITADFSAKRIHIGPQGIGTNAISTATITGNSNYVTALPGLKTYGVDCSSITNSGSITTTALATSTFTCSTFTMTGLPNSTITLQVAQSATSVGAPAGRVLAGGQDWDFQQNDVWCQQLRLGFANPGGSASTEIAFYPPDGTNPKGLNVAGSDRTLRIVSTLNSGIGGYLLDTFLNPPLFSTINGQVNLVAFQPAPTTGTVGVSTISRMNPVSLYGRSTLAGGVVEVKFSPAYANSNEYSVVLTYKDTAGGSPLHANITSISSFTANGSATNEFYWQTIGRV